MTKEPTMEIMMSMVAFFALVLSWFVLPASPKPARLPEAALRDAVPAAA